MSIEDLESWHLLRIRALSNADVDVFAVETMPSVKEAIGKEEHFLQIIRNPPNCARLLFRQRKFNFYQDDVIFDKSLFSIILNCISRNPPNCARSLFR